MYILLGSGLYTVDISSLFAFAITIWFLRHKQPPPFLSYIPTLVCFCSCSIFPFWVDTRLFIMHIKCVLDTTVTLCKLECYPYIIIKLISTDIPPEYLYSQMYKLHIITRRRVIVILFSSFTIFYAYIKNELGGKSANTLSPYFKVFVRVEWSDDAPWSTAAPPSHNALFILVSRPVFTSMVEPTWKALSNFSLSFFLDYIYFLFYVQSLLSSLPQSVPAFVIMK